MVIVRKDVNGGIWTTPDPLKILKAMPSPEKSFDVKVINAESPNNIFVKKAAKGLCFATSAP
jgi:hypothetical protein